MTRPVENGREPSLSDVLRQHHERRRAAEEAERENGPECLGCETACDGCPEGDGYESPTPSDPLPEAPVPIDVRSFRSYQPVEAGDDPF